MRTLKDVVHEHASFPLAPLNEIEEYVFAVPPTAQVHELIEAADLNGLLRVIDAFCQSRSWDDLLELANLCEEALERGKQLWPIAAHADYRLALEAPGEIAAEVLTDQPNKFGPGPLTEVAASTHTWSELAPHIASPVAAAYVAQERVLRGEVLDDDRLAQGHVLEMPLHMESWEPVYALATYGPTHVEVAEPWEPKAQWITHEQPHPADELDDPDLVAALLDLVQPWVAESNGAARATVIEGDAPAAAAALTVGPIRTVRLEVAEVLRELAWAAASGGAHGARRGAAFGRFAAWYAGAVACDSTWPVPADELQDRMSRLGWFRWDEGAADEGWSLRIAIESPEGWAAAISASDTLLDEGRDDER